MRKTLLVAACLLPTLTQAQQWGNVAMVSTTMGVNANKICIGEGLRVSDIGCPTYAPTVTSAGGVSVTGNVSANQFIGDGSLLTGIASWGDRITSGTTSIVAVSDTGYISITQLGTPTGWFNPQTGFVTIGVSSTGVISGTGGYFNGYTDIVSSGVPYLRILKTGSRQYNMVVGSSNATNFDIRDLSASGSPSRLSINSYGNVGFGGQTNPNATLHVSGTFTVSNTTQVTTPSIYVSSGLGYVGIGTSNPASFLHVQNDTTAATVLNVANSTNGGSSAATLQLNSTGGQLDVQNLSSIQGGWSNLKTNGTALRLMSYASSGYMSFFTGGSAASYERIRIDPSGSVGIGTVTPTASLQVSGTFIVSNSAQVTTPSIYVGSNGQVSIGNTNTGAALNLTAPSSNGYEPMAYFGTSSLFNMLAFSNNSNNSARASPVIVGRSNHSQYGALGIAAWGSAEAVGSPPLMTFTVGLNGGDIVTGTSTAASMRNLYSFNNSTTNVMLIRANGNVALGGLSVPSATLHVSGTVLTTSWTGINFSNQTGNWTPTAPLEVSGTISATALIINGQTITGSGSGQGDRITSGTSSVIVNQDGNISFTTTGTQVMVISGSNVGIGISNPVYAVDVTGSGRFSTTLMANRFAPLTNTGASGNGIYLAGTNILGFSTNGVERFRIDSSGNVGIGNNSPTATLHVSGTFTVSNSAQITTPTLYVSNGYVGIGTSSPGTPLYVIGTTHATTFEPNDGGGLQWNGNVSLKGSTAFNRIYAYTNNVLRLLIDNGGNIGIGTATDTPSQSLHIGGTLLTTSWTAINFPANTRTTPTVPLEVSGTISATAFVGNGSGLTGVTAQPSDRISTTNVASGASLGAAVADIGTVSFTLGGTAGAAYLHPNLGLVAAGVSATGTVSGTRGYFSGVTIPGYALELGDSQLFNVGGWAGTTIYGKSDGRSVVGSNLYANGGTFYTINTHGSFGYSGIYQTFGGINFMAYSGATTANGSVTPAYRVVIGPTTTAINNQLITTSNTGINLASGAANPSASLQVSGTFIVSITNQISSPSIYAGSNGNVGIGTNAPNALLDVEGAIEGSSMLLTGTGTATVRSTLTAGASEYGFLNRVGNASGYLRYGNSSYPGFNDTLLLGTINGQPLVFLTSSTEAVRIVSSGYVGIGTSAPSAQLSVSGTITYTGILTDLSDRRAKTNIEALPNSLEDLLELQPVSYRKKSSPGQLEYGFIAQDVERTFPNLVMTANDASNTKSLNYIGLIAPSVKAIQELNTKLEANNALLQRQLQAANDNIERLRRDLDALRRTLQPGR